ncbi:MAG TPA: single-stranded DNA-binding protein [Anaerolineae bacterium]
MSTYTPFETQVLLLLDRIARALESMAMTQAPAPNYSRTLAAFRSFDFATINATVKTQDSFGPAVVEWGGFTWTRRNSQDKKKGNAIWFSRVIGGTVAEGNVKYARLITFKDNKSEPEPLADEIARKIGNGR